jgi:hypothetical protein
VLRVLTWGQAQSLAIVIFPYTTLCAAWTYDDTFYDYMQNTPFIILRRLGPDEVQL